MTALVLVAIIIKNCYYDNNKNNNSENDSNPVHFYIYVTYSNPEVEIFFMWQRLNDHRYSYNYRVLK